MSAISSAVERARKASASIARIERAIENAPEDESLHLNLSSARKLALQATHQLRKAAEFKHIDICSYRLMPELADNYLLANVSRSYLEFQNLFSQIHDSLKNGAKQKAQIGDEARHESALEFGYSYSGSLGVVLLASSERGFFEGKLDKSVDAFFEVVSMDAMKDAKSTAQQFGKAVLKRLYDVRWTRSDGRELGRVIERDRMANMLSILSQASDEKTDPLELEGILVGGDVMSGAFHFVVPDGDSIRGSFDQFSDIGELTLDKRYIAKIDRTTVERYATDEVTKKYVLRSLSSPKPNDNGRG